MTTEHEVPVPPPATPTSLKNAASLAYLEHRLDQLDDIMDRVTDPALGLAAPPVPLSVGQAIAAVMGRLPAIGKTEEASGVPYKFRGIEAMTAALQPIMAEVGLVIIPQARSMVFDHSPGQKEAWQDVTMQFDWLIIGPDGSTVTATTFGIGRDHTDKGANKAQTQAFKYLIMHLFCVSDPKDDGDAHDYTDAPDEALSPAPKDAAVEATFTALAGLKGTDDAATIKTWAGEQGGSLTEKALAEDPEWRAQVDDKLAALAAARDQDAAAEGDPVDLFADAGLIDADSREVDTATADDAYEGEGY